MKNQQKSLGFRMRRIGEPDKEFKMDILFEWAATGKVRITGRM